MSGSQLISTSGPIDHEHEARADHFIGETPIQISNPLPAATMLLHAPLRFSKEHTAALHLGSPKRVWPQDQALSAPETHPSPPGSTPPAEA